MTWSPRLAIRILKSFEFLFLMSFIVGFFGSIWSLFRITLTVPPEKNIPGPDLYVYDAATHFRSIFWLDAETIMLLGLSGVIIMLLLNIRVCMRMTDGELKAINENVALYRKLRAFRFSHVVTAFTFLRKNFLRLFLEGLQIFLIPPYLFREVRVKNGAVTRMLDPKHSEISPFHRWYVIIEVNRYQDSQSISGNDDTVRTDIVKVSKRLYQALYPGASLRVFCQYHRHYKNHAKIRLVH